MQNGCGLYLRKTRGEQLQRHDMDLVHNLITVKLKADQLTCTVRTKPHLMILQAFGHAGHIRKTGLTEEKL